MKRADQGVTATPDDASGTEFVRKLAASFSSWSMPSQLSSIGWNGKQLRGLYGASAGVRHPGESVMLLPTFARKLLSQPAREGWPIVALVFTTVGAGLIVEDAATDDPEVARLAAATENYDLAGQPGSRTLLHVQLSDVTGRTWIAHKLRGARAETARHFARVEAMVADVPHNPELRARLDDSHAEIEAEWAETERLIAQDQRLTERVRQNLEAGPDAWPPLTHDDVTLFNAVLQLRSEGWFGGHLEVMLRASGLRLVEADRRGGSDAATRTAADQDG